jgi:glycosyltransferase involved in cell wall biosynthesis
MLTTSYPRFAGDGVGTFMEPIATGVAALGHEVHVVAPWHPMIDRTDGDRLHFHFYRYAPFPSLNVYGYAGALKADVALRPAAYLAAPLAMASGWRTLRRVVRETGATILHAHWVIPNGVVATASGRTLPLVVSLHGSDVFVAERHRLATRAARFTFCRTDRVTACSEDLLQRAVRLGADPRRASVVPYGVDTTRFAPDAAARHRIRTEAGIGPDRTLVLTAGRLVRKKGFEFLIDAVASLADRCPAVTLAIVGDGDLGAELRARASAGGIADRVLFVGTVTQDEVAAWLAAADIAVVPSVRDDAGNVDGLPNIVLEALASATPVIATPAGGIATVAEDGRTAVVVPERDVTALAAALERLVNEPDTARTLGVTARASVGQTHVWARVAERFDETYTQAVSVHAGR